jgi:hypothetical protein
VGLNRGRDYRATRRGSRLTCGLELLNARFELIHAVDQGLQSCLVNHLFFRSLCSACEGTGNQGNKG